MTRFADSPVVEVSVDIEADIDTVWSFVTDINVSGQFQDEFQRAEWIDDGPALEARFTGHNERKGAEWDTTSWVTTYEPKRAFGWVVSDRDNPGSQWTFRLEPRGPGVHLTYHRILGPGPSGITSYIERHPEIEEEAIASRDATHHANMTAVVEGIKALAEG